MRFNALDISEHLLYALNIRMNTATTMQPVTVRLTRALKRALETAAKRDHRTVTAMIRLLVQQGLERRALEGDSK